jgi:amino acid transporter
MNSFSSLLKKEHRGQLILTIIFIIYLILGYRTPQPVAFLVDNIVGKIVIFIIVIYMFLYMNPILAVITLFVAFDLMRRSSMSVNNNLIQSYIPSEENKMNQFTAFNQFPYTLEQEVVKKMAPIVQSGSVLKKASYKPMLEDLYGASPVNSSN